MTAAAEPWLSMTCASARRHVSQPALNAMLSFEGVGTRRAKNNGNVRALASINARQTLRFFCSRFASGRGVAIAVAARVNS